MITRTTLNGKYWMTYLPFGADGSFVFSEDFVPYGWLEARVPEDIRTTLRRGGYLSGPYLGKDLDAERWIEECDWLYYRRFACGKSEGKAYLHFEGIDTFAVIYLNGVQVGTNRNMFLPNRIEVSSLLRPGEMNTLCVRILSPIHSVAGKERAGLYPQDATDRLFVRKAQMNYGWDFCGRCLSGGIWKDIWLEHENGGSLEDLYLRTVRISSEGTADLLLQFRTRGLDEGNEYSVHMTLADQNGTTYCSSTEDVLQGELRLSLPEAKLWWPRPYGEAHLYQVCVRLLCRGTVQDSREFRHGIRTIELDQRKLPQGGRAFSFIVNGRPLFIRGANWVPINAVYTDIRPSDYDDYLDMAQKANLSMLRVWGGGIYEHARFYDLCDEKGILVMQDFMLACGILPQDEEFLRQVEEEVAHMVVSLRNRTCIAIWSGDNELDQAYWWYEMEHLFKTNQVNRKAVRNAVCMKDPHRPFIHSSPASPHEGEPGHDDPNSPLQGDMHIYLTRFEPSSPYYYKKILEFVPRFLSEYGFSSLPSEHSYGRFNFLRRPLDLAANPWLGELPAFMALKTDREKIYYSQFSHAQGLKYWIEYLRSHRGVCGGSLYWKFNDPVAPNHKGMLFPSLMSSVDFYGQPKMAFYYSRRAYEDLILAFRETLEGDLEVYACNETQQTDRGVLTLSLWGAEGMLEQISQNAVDIPADQSVLLTGTALCRSMGEDRYYLAVFQGRTRLENRFFPLDIARYIGIKPQRCRLDVRVNLQEERCLQVHLAADRYAQDVMLDAFPVRADYSDNAFCMDAGGERQLQVTLKEGSFRGAQLVVKAANAERIVIQL